MKRRIVIKGAAATVALLAASGPVIDALRRPHTVASAREVPLMKSTQPWFFPLTPSQAEVSELVAAGLTNKEIAKATLRATNTVDNHVYQVLTKLDFHRRSEIGDWVARKRPARYLMSSREFQLAALIAAGFTDGEIAKRFGVSKRTLEAHLQSIAMKLDLRLRAQIGDWVIDNRRRHNPLSRV